ncbi:MAG: hypothetical protein ACE5IC_07190 [Candidatus Brocadiales bacterium]
MQMIQGLKARLAELEGKKRAFEENVKRKEELINTLNGHKKKMLELKERYDSEVMSYIDSLIELEDVNEMIKRLGSELEIKHFMGYLVDIPGLYGYLGNLGERNQGLVIHESIAPATHGCDLWKLIRRRR